MMGAADRVAKKKKPGIRIKKGAIIKGVRIKSAKTRDKVVEMLQQAEKMKKESAME